MNKLNEEQLYYAVFFLLDRFYDQYEEEFKGGLFEVFLSAMDPFVFVDSRSADPAMSIEFEKCFKKTFGERNLIGFDEGFQFIKIYFDYFLVTAGVPNLGLIYAFDLQSIFKRLSKKDWEKCCNYAIEFLKGNKN